MGRQKEWHNRGRWISLGDQITTPTTLNTTYTEPNASPKSTRDTKPPT